MENHVTSHFVGKWRPLLRQFLVASGTWCTFFTLGLLMGTPTVAGPQMRREGAPLTDDMLSWLSSTFCYSAIPWVFILPYAAQTCGRKKTLTFISFSTIVTFITFSFTTSPVPFIITEILIGIQHGGTLTTSILVLTEYTIPKYRGLFLTIKSASIFWGVWLANTIGTFTHWTYISKFGLVCAVYTLTVFFWPESPYWLASKKRFVEAITAHRWLKGVGKNEEFELEELIASFSDNNSDVLPNNEDQTKTENMDKKNNKSKNTRIKLNLQLVKQREFYMPLFLSFVAVFQYHLSGKFVITMYAIDIMKKIVNNEAKAYRSMLILDGVTVFSTYTGCILSRILKRRTLLLSATFSAIIFLFIMSLYLFLVKIEVVTENMHVSVFFLAGFSISISCGPMIMSTTLYGELIPARYKNICLIIVATSFLTIHGTLLKIAPITFRLLTMPGLFLFYGICSLCCFVLMYLYLPETKDKTLLEIEAYFKEGSKDEMVTLVRS